jgi:predicted SAM-dependent methyltransferase
MNFGDYLCPACEATDRDRLYAVYLKDYLESSTGNVDLVEFGPTPQLSNFIKGFANVKYRSADLYRELADDVVDLTNMTAYRDESFDFVICSHMLEHIDDDEAASRELFRILRKGGKGIVMVPIDLSLKENYEKPEVVTDEGRWKHFGQFDHVRLYSKAGFIGLLEDAGFDVEQLGVEHFGKEVFKKAGVHDRSVLYIVTKE